MFVQVMFVRPMMYVHVMFVRPAMSVHMMFVRWGLFGGVCSDGVCSSRDGFL